MYRKMMTICYYHEKNLAENEFLKKMLNYHFPYVKGTLTMKVNKIEIN